MASDGSDLVVDSDSRPISADLAAEIPPEKSDLVAEGEPRAISRRVIILDPATLSALALAVGLLVYVARRALNRGRLERQWAGEPAGRHVPLRPNHVQNERPVHAHQGRGSMLML